MDTRTVPFSRIPARPREHVASRAQIDGFDMLDCIGEGPFASVYRARRHADGAVVACKVLSTERSAGVRATERFLREIEVMKSLCHPRLLTLLSAGVSSGHIYLVTPFCQGGNLEGRVSLCGGRLPVAEAAEYMISVLEGLSTLHERGFVHRDVKPTNVLLDASGAAVLADFGIAKSFVEAGLSGVTSAAGTAFGTPAFMAREQVTNYRFVDPVTDVWAASATLYFLLAGQPPRDMAGHRNVVNAILEGKVVPLVQRAPQVPRRLAMVIDRGLAEQVDERYPNAGQLLVALRRAA